MTAIAPPPDPLTVELAVAAVGIRPFVAKELRRVFGYHQDRAQGIPATIDRQIYRFIQRDEPEPTAELPDFDYDEIAGLLDAETLPAHVEAQIAAFGESGDLALAVNLQVQRIVAYLKQKLPRRVHQSLAGPEYTRPPETDIARFARTWAIACDPMSLLDDLNEYAVSRDQVVALGDLYPKIYALFSPSVQTQLARAKSVSPSFHLMRQKETLLRVLTKQEAPNIALGKAIQAMYAEQAAAAAPQAPPPNNKNAKGADSEATASQRIDQ